MVSKTKLSQVRIQISFVGWSNLFTLVYNYEINKSKQEISLKFTNKGAM